jgi:hypothetical protein
VPLLSAPGYVLDKNA